MIERFGPYLELATIAETLGTPERIGYASDQFIHDLAVWYHLAWLGETVRRTHPLVARLTERGRDFTAAQRRELLALHRRARRRRWCRATARSPSAASASCRSPRTVTRSSRCCWTSSARAMRCRRCRCRSTPATPGGAARAALACRGGVARLHARLRRTPGGLLAGRRRDQCGDAASCWPPPGAFAGRRAAPGCCAAASRSAIRQAAADPLAYNRPYRVARHAARLLLPRRRTLGSHRLHLRHLARR